MMIAVLAFVAGYVAGAIPLGLLVPMLAKGVDVRHHGTGNIGAANVRESAGLLPGMAVAFGVFLQGLLPPLAARWLDAPPTVVAAAAVGSVVGYGWPVFLRFKGGRALGTGTGAAAAISPMGFLILLLSYATGALLGQTSLGTLLGFVVYAAYVFKSTDFPAYAVAVLCLLVVIILRRMEGIGSDLQRGPVVPTVLNLLLFQRRPNRQEREEHDA